MTNQRVRCINLDWLEIYALEPFDTAPHDAHFFVSAGWIVKQREYGTPIYHEMFTLYGTDGLPLLEVRRNPKSAIGVNVGGVLDPRATHIRLCNRSCYLEDAAKIMDDFLRQYGYTFMRISRLDLALDFERFDYGDDPQKFVQRYVSGKYAKINQSEIALHGLDCWDGRYFNSVRWGSKKSMVSTKLYDKTMELQQVHDKPYIRQAWYEAKLVDDWRTLEKYTDDGTPYKPRIWRLEFSIKSSEKNWFVVENPYQTKPRLRSIRHTLDRYFTRKQMCDVFFSLCEHYFHFKKVLYQQDDKNPSERKLVRKDRCPDKQLFDTSAIGVFYKLANIATNEAAGKKESRLLKYLYEYKATTIKPSLHKALDTIIEQLETSTHTEDFTQSLDEKTIQVMRLLIQRRMHAGERSLADDIETIRHYIDNEPTLF